MTGLGLRLYTDEDVHADLAGKLRALGYDVVSCFEAGDHNQRLSDDWQLRYATQNQRTILVHNIRDYVRRDREWKAAGDAHAGILAVAKRTPLGELVRRTCAHLDTIEPSAQYNVLRYLVR